MNVYLSDPQQPDTPEPKQPTRVERETIRRLIAAVDEIEAPTRYDNPHLPSHKDGPTIGDTPPVVQPGRPPMSQKAVDLNTTILSSSVLAAVLGGSATAVIWASGNANPTVIGWICGCVVAVPAALTLPVLALKGLMKSAKEVVQAAPAEQHVHVHGNVYEDNRSYEIESKGVWVKNHNHLPR